MAIKHIAITKYSVVFLPRQLLRFSRTDRKLAGRCWFFAQRIFAVTHYTKAIGIFRPVNHFSLLLLCMFYRSTRRCLVACLILPSLNSINSCLTTVFRFGSLSLLFVCECCVIPTVWSVRRKLFRYLSPEHTVENMLK